VRILCLVCFFVLAGCSTKGMVSNVRDKALLISFGDSKEKVIEVLGTPGDRSFSADQEAWQYCSTGWTQDSYLTVWFASGYVTGVTTQSASLADGFCSGAFPRVDWGQVPADQKIEVNIN